MRMTVKEWNTLVKQKAFKDLDDKEPKGFLMVYQFMKGKIIWNEKNYQVTGWQPPAGKPYVELDEIVGEQ